MIELTKKQEDLIPKHKAKWQLNSVKTDPISNDEKDKIEDAARSIYAKNDIQPPPVHYVESPFQGSLLAAILLARAERPGLFPAGGIKHAVRMRFKELVKAGVYEEGDFIKFKRPFASQTRIQVKEDPDVGDMILAKVKEATTRASYGNLYSGRAAFISFARDVLKVNEIDYKAWEPYEILTKHSSIRYMHEKFCIFADRPCEIHVDGNNNPTNDQGPALRWRDNSCLFYFQSVKVPRDWVMHKDLVNPSDIVNEHNAELRRAGMELIGWIKFLDFLKAKEMDKDPDPTIGTLYKCYLDGREVKLLRVLCGTGREFGIPVPKSMRTALEANSWVQFNLEPEIIKNFEAQT